MVMTCRTPQDSEESTGDPFPECYDGLVVSESQNCAEFEDEDYARVIPGRWPGPKVVR